MALTYEERPGSRVYRDVPVRREPSEKKRIHLHIDGIRRLRESFDVRVFLDAPDADETTSTDDPAFAGSLSMYGQGPSPDPEAPLREYDPATDRSGPHDAHLNITEAIERVGLTRSVDITLVLIDQNGNPLPPSAFEPEEIFITAPD